MDKKLLKENSNAMLQLSRRNALKTIAAASATLLVTPHHLFCASKKQKNKLGVALVGLGYYSTDLLAPALQQTKHCYLAGIVTGTPAKEAIWAKKYNIPAKNIYNYQNFDEVANNPAIDVIYVVLPPSMHKEYVIRAANAGKHVWCEKPMAVTAEDCQAMIDACNKNKRSLAIGYRLQHEPNTKAYTKIVNEQQLGKVLRANCGAGYREGRTNHWKQTKELGGGVLLDMGVYSIQGARLGTGMEPLAVTSAKLWTERPDVYTNGLEEIAEATLEFSGGVIAKIKTTFAENINFLDITCEKGNINVAPYQAYAGVKATSPLGTINNQYNVPWQQANQMDEDALSIMQNKPMLAPGEEGLRDIAIVQAIKKSAATGNRVALNTM